MKAMSFTKQERIDFELFVEDCVVKRLAPNTAQEIVDALNTAQLGSSWMRIHELATETSPEFRALALKDPIDGALRFFCAMYDEHVSH